MRRPIGVLILAALIAFLGISAIVMGIYFLMFLLNPAGVDRLYTLMIAMVSIGTGGMGIYIAKGLWDMKAWARTTSIVLLVFVFIGSIGGAISGKPTAIAVVVLSMIFVIYLIRNDIKACFTGSCKFSSSK